MPFCVQCRCEYVDEVNECTDCGARLVAALPEDAPPPDPHWARLASPPTEAQGEMLVETLEQAGIRCLLKRDVFMSAFGSQGTSVFVAREQLAQAQELRRELSGG